MRRSGPPQRKTPLKTNVDQVRRWQDRTRKAIPQESAKRKAERPIRAEVRAQVIARDGGCRARGIAPGRCEGRPGRAPLEVHEVQGRGVRPGGHLDPENCLALCPGHHDWVTTHPAEALELGLRIKGG